MEFTDYDTRLAAYAVLVRDDEMLLTWFNGSERDTPGWSLPGGGVDYLETPAQGLVREVREESGYDVVIGDVLAVDTFTEPTGRARPFKAVRLLYDARIVGGTLGTLEVGGSTDYAQWVPLADVASQPSRADIVDLAVVARRGR